MTEYFLRLIFIQDFQLKKILSLVLSLGKERIDEHHFTCGTAW